MKNTATRTSRNLVLCIVVLFISFLGSAQDTGYLDKVLTIKELQEDFEIFKHELETKHPGLYTYSKKSKVDSVFGEIQKSLNTESSGIQFYRKLVILNSVIKDNHTKVISPESFRIARDKNLPRFPFAVHVEDDKVVVLRNLSNNKEIKPGWQILKINDEPIENILSVFLNTSPRNGFNNTLPIARLNLFFSSLYATLIGYPNNFRIECKDLQGNILKVDLAALTTDKVTSNYYTKYGKPTAEIVQPISYEINKNIAILKVSSFSPGVIENKGKSFKRQFKNIFEEIENKNIKNLIVDLRNNRGGWDEVGDELLSYLVPESFIKGGSDFSLINTIENKDYYIKNEYIKHFERLKFKKIKNGYSIYWKGKPIKPKKKLFSGTLIILINAVSASQTGLVAGFLKDKTNALFIGEETGGNPKEVCAGDIITLELPNSKVQVAIPLRKLTANIGVENNGRGVVPDYEKIASLNDKISSNDSALDFAIDLINQREAFE